MEKEVYAEVTIQLVRLKDKFITPKFEHKQYEEIADELEEALLPIRLPDGWKLEIIR